MTVLSVLFVLSCCAWSLYVLQPVWQLRKAYRKAETARMFDDADELEA